MGHDNINVYVISGVVTCDVSKGLGLIDRVSGQVTERSEQAAATSSCCHCFLPSKVARLNGLISIVHTGYSGLWPSLVDRQELASV